MRLLCRRRRRRAGVSLPARDGARFRSQFDGREDAAPRCAQGDAHEHPLLGDAERRTARDAIGDGTGDNRGLAAAERARGICRGIREAHMMPDELHRREACREHEGDRGQRDGELRRHAAPIPFTRP